MPGIDPEGDLLCPGASCWRGVPISAFLSGEIVLLLVAFDLAAFRDLVAG